MELLNQCRPKDCCSGLQRTPGEQHDLGTRKRHCLYSQRPKKEKRPVAAERLFLDRSELTRASVLRRVKLNQPVPTHMHSPDGDVNGRGRVAGTSKVFC